MPSNSEWPAEARLAMKLKRAPAVPAAPAAAFIAPMKALGSEHPPADANDEWLCEIKFDGYRVIAVLNAGKVELWSRNHKPLVYPELNNALEKLKCRNAVLDGEVVALDESGRTNFQTLQGRDIGERPKIILYLFDLLFLNGERLTALPIEKRQEQLARLVKKPSLPLQLSPTFPIAPAIFLAKTKEQGLEGMILKRRGSGYEPDRRSGAWLKVKNVNEQEFVIGGMTPPKNSRQGFGALLVGYYDKDRLIYSGKVGTGFDTRLLQALHEKFARLAVEECPFVNLPLDHRSRFGQGMTWSVMKTVTWLRPKTVAQIKFSEWTREGILRQPVFLGIRTDKAAREVKREIGAKPVRQNIWKTRSI